MEKLLNTRQTGRGGLPQDCPYWLSGAATQVSGESSITVMHVNCMVFTQFQSSNLLLRFQTYIIQDTR